jgi:flagellar hook-length control protein FliK
MFSALFPVQKDVTTDGLPGAETPGSAKNGGEGEKNDRFARLLFVSQMRDVSAKEQKQIQNLLFEPRMLRASPLLTDFISDDIQKEGEASASSEEDLLQSSLFAAPSALSLELPAGAAEMFDFEEAHLVSGEDICSGVPLADAAEESFFFGGGESGAVRPAGNHQAGKMSASAGEGNVPSELLRRMESTLQTDESISATEIEKQSAAKPSSVTDACSGASFSPRSGETDARNAVSRRNVATFAASSPPAPDLNPVAEDKAGTPAASHLFSLSMTDNIRPRRNLAFAGALVASTESGEGTSTVASRVSSASALPGFSESASILAVAVDAAVSTSATHHALKAVAESELSTNDLPGGPEEELNLFPAARSLFGESADGKSAQPLSSARALSEKESPFKKEDGNENAVTASGKENSDTAASFSAIRSLQQQGGQSAISERFVQIPLQGQDGAALEDGVQHVVRFLKAEGRHAASIIIDPPALGRVDVELVTTTKGVEASIKVATEQIRELVQDHIAVLRNHLEQQGVHLGEFVVDLRDNTKGNSGGNSFREEGGSRRRQVSSAESEDTEENVIPSFRMDLEYGLLAWVA